MSRLLCTHPCAAGKSKAAAWLHCSSVVSPDLGWGLAASSEYLPQRDHSLVFSVFFKLDIEVCLAIQCC